MTVGSIPLPQIIPLRNRPSGPFQIDTNTLIEIHCDRSDVDIYYTLDGAQPDTLATLASRKSTIEYFQPFYVPREIGKAGKVTIKAVAVARYIIFDPFSMRMTLFIDPETDYTRVA